MWQFIKLLIWHLCHHHEWERVSAYELECKTCGDIKIKEEK